MFLLRLGLLYLVYLYHVNLQNQRLELVKQVCPYYKLCKQNSSTTENDSPPAGYVSCCLPCKCDEKCYEFSDCCPDAPVANEPRKRPRTTCRSALYEDQYVNLNLSTKKYLMIQNCPNPDNSSTARRCNEDFEETPIPDDIAVVSDINDPSRIYRNKYCALCNGVKESKRWNMRVLKCIVPALTLHFSLSKTRSILMENCAIESYPEPSEAHLLPGCPESHECGGVKNEAEPDVVSACEQSFAPTLIQTVSGINRVIVYKNVYCFVCVEPQSANRAQICSKLIVEEASRLPPLIMFMDLREDIITKRLDGESLIGHPSNCSEDSFYDYVFSECRKLHCAGLAAVFQAKCVSFANFPPNSELGIFVNFIPTSSTPVNLTDLQVSQRNIRTLEMMFLNKNKLEDCSFFVYRIDCYLERSGHTLEFIRIHFHRILTEKCTYEYLIQQLQKTIALQWRQEIKIGSYVFQTIGRVNFFMFEAGKPSHGNDPNVVSKTIFMLEKALSTTLITPVRVFTEMFLCPYFILNASDYYGYLQKVYDEFINISNETLTAKTDLHNGFYLMPENKVAVCFDTYFDFSNKANFINESFRLILVVASVCVLSWSLVIDICI